MKKLKELRDDMSCQFTILRDNYENNEKARAFNAGFDKAVKIVNNWNELVKNDKGTYDSIGEEIPETIVPILFKKEGDFVFYFAGHFDGKMPIVNTNMVVTHWRHIERA